MSLGRRTKTEHAGAKNGGGFWGPRQEAKTVSKKLRRRRELEDIRLILADLELCYEAEGYSIGDSAPEDVFAAYRRLRRRVRR